MADAGRGGAGGGGITWRDGRAIVSALEGGGGGTGAALLGTAALAGAAADFDGADFAATDFDGTALDGAAAFGGRFACTLGARVDPSEAWPARALAAGAVAEARDGAGRLAVELERRAEEGIFSF